MQSEISLRPYQLDAVAAVKEGFEHGSRQYIEMPTGSGKTVTFLTYAKENHKKILIIVPSIHLMNQVYESALELYPARSISRKGDRIKDKPRNVHICVIHSIRDNYLDFLSEQPFDLIIIDEAHHAMSASYKRFLNRRSDLYDESEMLVLGVTATPDRADGQMLDEVLHDRTYQINVETLINDGYLSDIEGFSVKTNLDISDVDSHNGDFSLNGLYKKLCITSRNQMIIDLVKKEMSGRKSLLFCINIKHSKMMVNLLEMQGISAAHIDGTMNHTVRKKILAGFRKGEFSVLCNCQLLTEGFDEPSIDGIVIARPTRSRGLFTQMIGRGLRLSPGKSNCKIIDIVDNHKYLCGFNSLLDDHPYPEMTSFESIKDIREHLGNEMLKITEFRIERADLLNRSPFKDLEAVHCMIDYLDNNNIYYQHPITFDEASFLIWHNKLKEKYYGTN